MTDRLHSVYERANQTRTFDVQKEEGKIPSIWQNYKK